MRNKSCFFKSPPTSSFLGTEYCIQIPSANDIEQMRKMYAGDKEDQSLRLTHMTQKIKQIQVEHPDLPVMTTDKITLPPAWGKLFAAIKKGDDETALSLLKKIPVRDTVLQALLTIHTFDYLEHLVVNCIKAKPNGVLKLDSDIIITPGTFEILVKDLAATLLSCAKVYFAFGLPTHHASSAQGSGFCVLDKTAILIQHAKKVNKSPLKFIIIGTDVNRDNGLCRDLIDTAHDFDICHIDIFDSRVYPYQDHDFINKEFNSASNNAGQGVNYWTCGKINYFAVDLSLTLRKKEGLHPALNFTLIKMREQIKNAKACGQQIMLFLPTGWDSHQEETAFCGKYVNGKMMDQEEAQKTRFSDEDLSCFYEKVFELYGENQEAIAGMYWGLEGGYSRPMYEKQIQLLLSLVLEKLINADEEQLDMQVENKYPK